MIADADPDGDGLITPLRIEILAPDGATVLAARDDPLVLSASALVDEVRDFLDARGDDLTLVAGTELMPLRRALLRRVPRATKARKPGFVRSRRRALDAIAALRDALAP